MKIADNGYATSVVIVGNLARKMQAASAPSGNDKEGYKLATDIMLECQNIREKLNHNTTPRTISDYIKRILP